MFVFNGLGFTGPNYYQTHMGIQYEGEVMQGHLCFYSVGIDQLPRKQQGDIRAVLAVLAETKRFSSFEATANRIIASTMDRLGNEGYIRSVGGSYPWCEIEITDKGKELLADAA